jgi:prepilin-type N-terminal cleavage/methylation domain-containing protein
VIGTSRYRSAWGRLGGERGFTLAEMLVVLLILAVVIVAITQLFISGIKSENDQTLRAQAQIDARLALDQLRREVHCAGAVNPNPNGTWPTQAITVSLGTWCHSNTTGATTYVTWCTVSLGSGRYQLWRYPHGGTDTSTFTYANACTGSGRIWVTDVVNYRTITNGQIFFNPVIPTNPALGEADLAYAGGSGSLGDSTISVTYGYIIDPVVSGVEQPGTENLITTRAGTTNKQMSVDWSRSCAAYSPNTIGSFMVYRHRITAPSTPYYLIATVVNTPPATGCNFTSVTDSGSGTTVGTPVGSNRAALSVTIPVRADKNSGVRLISLPDALTLRNTPR